MFSPNAIGVGAINAVPTFAPTPMALGLNVKPLIHDRVRYNVQQGCDVRRLIDVRAEVSCAMKQAGPPRLLVVGTFTRLAALGGAVTMAVAFFLVHGGKLSGQNSGEMAFLYLVGFVAIFLTGPGCFALDTKLGGRSNAAK